jgi:hypothetical protein
VSSSKSTVAVSLNPHNSTWEVGWQWDNGEFTPYLCGFPTKEEAEAQIPGFDQHVDSDLEAYEQQRHAIEREQNEMFPNLAHVRAKIKKIKDPLKAFDAQERLHRLLNMDLHEHISWPLPSWHAIESHRVYGL